jgi:uncharacterized protein (DUF3820 family)
MGVRILREDRRINVKNIKMDDNSIMPYGAHKGKKMANVPDDYLLWCYDQPWCRGEVKKYIEDNFEVKKK